MTKINRITIHGFKSFAHKTNIDFNDKFNCILGPNGSGKSNVGDSICFVLGRLSAKSMRAEKAANLIFNGGKSKKPADTGTVEIAFSNDQNTFPEKVPEIVVSRTITKEGNSVYKINEKKKTRTEVLDLLSIAKINPEGHNIILQGDITRFVEMSPLDRRKIIEEISDVSLYEEKKHKAILELNKVDEQLNSAEIILKERKTYLKELQKDRDQALKFKELKNKIDSHKATFVYLQIEERKNINEKYNREISAQQEKIGIAEKNIALLKEKAGKYKMEIAGINQEIERKGEKEQIRVHKVIEDLKVSVARDKTRISALKDEINKIQQRKDQFREEIKELECKSSSFGQNQKELQQKLDLKKKELLDVEQQIGQFRKKNKIESSLELDKELEESDKIIELKQEEVQQIRQKQQELLRSKDRIEYQLQSIDERIKKVSQVAEEHREQISLLHKHKSDFKSAALQLNQLLEQDSSFASQIGNARKNFLELQEKQAALNAKAASFQAGLSSNLAIKSILDNKKKFKGVHGLIAELGQANKKFSLALETAAGQRMQNIVVDDDKTAAECIDYLKDNKLGTASFIPLNKIRTQDITSDDEKLRKLPGVHDFAVNLISFKNQYKKAFSYVFGNTLIVEDINVARKVGIGRIKMATIDGNSVEASGVMKGGFVARKAALGFKEHDSSEALDKVEDELAETQSIISLLEDKREGNLKGISALRNMKAELEAEMIKLEKTLHLNTDDLEATSSLKKELVRQSKETNDILADVQRNIASINKDLASLKSRKQILRSQVSELRNPRLLAQLSAFEESKHQCKEELVRLESEMKNNSLRIEQMVSPEMEKIKGIMKQHDKEEAQFALEIKNLTAGVNSRETELTEKEKESRDFYSKYRELFTRREKLTAEITKADNETESEREKMRNAEREANLVSLKNAEIKAKLAGLQEELARFGNAPILKKKSAEELQGEINKYEILLAQMAAVNMKALEVYEQVETEFNKLVEKKASLDKEKIDVLAFMNEIETKKKDHFMKTFTQAGQNFERIFSSLFKKGKAFLELENPNKPFEEGLSIKVKLTGNRFMDIKSLSGGEKTLTALSFIFAIQEYQPASFYILDEIDAALDKHNSETLAKLIRNYADKAQYIVISHNDSLIAEADTLYGISMNDGVSKVTSLRI